MAFDCSVFMVKLQKVLKANFVPFHSFLNFKIWIHFSWEFTIVDLIYTQAFIYVAPIFKHFNPCFLLGMPSRKALTFELGLLVVFW